MRERVADRPECVIKLGDVPGEFLAEGERRRIHPVGAPDFHDRHEFFGFFRKRIPQRFHGGDRMFHKFFVCGDGHGRGEGVVRGLGFVDVVVGVNQRLPFAEAVPCKDVGAVRDDFVAVHVRLRTGTRLPHDERELIVELAFDDLIAHFHDERCLFGGKNFELFVGDGGGLLEITERMDDFPRHGAAGAHGKVFVGALRLRAPVSVGWDFHRPHGVMFFTVLHDSRIQNVRRADFLGASQYIRSFN